MTCAMLLNCGVLGFLGRWIHRLLAGTAIATSRRCDFPVGASRFRFWISTVEKFLLGEIGSC